MSLQVIIARSKADADTINAEMASRIGCPIQGTYPDGSNGGVFTEWFSPREILHGPNAGDWYVLDVKDKWFNGQEKAQFTQWLNANITGYAREVLDPNWTNR